MCLDILKKINNLSCRQQVIKCSTKQIVIGIKTSVSLILTMEVGPARRELHSERLPIQTAAPCTHACSTEAAIFTNQNKAEAKKTTAILLWARKLKSKE